MRTESQIKRKLNELTMRKQAIEAEGRADAAEQIDRLEE
jgi:hypothetical protein